MRVNEILLRNICKTVQDIAFHNGKRHQGITPVYFEKIMAYVFSSNMLVASMEMLNSGNRSVSVLPPSSVTKGQHLLYLLLPLY